MKKMSDFSTRVLKDKCKSLGLAVAGTKADLFLRLTEKDPDDG